MRYDNYENFSSPNYNRFEICYTRLYECLKSDASNLLDCESQNDALPLYQVGLEGSGKL